MNSPLNAKAQNNLLSQDGDGAAEQETKQRQSYNQDNQVVSGDSNALSGNSVLCQNQDNSAQSNSCSTDEVSRPGASFLHITTVLHADCSINCPIPDGQVQLRYNSINTAYEANTHTTGGTTERTFLMAPGFPYTIHAVGASESSHHVYNYGNMEGDCVGRDTCTSFIPRDDGVDHYVTVHFHYLTK